MKTEERKGPASELLSLRLSLKALAGRSLLSNDALQLFTTL
jgi:hypothetical protein